MRLKEPAGIAGEARNDPAGVLGLIPVAISIFPWFWTDAIRLPHFHNLAKTRLQDKNTSVAHINAFMGLTRALVAYYLGDRRRARRSYRGIEMVRKHEPSFMCEVEYFDGSRTRVFTHIVTAASPALACEKAEWATARDHGKSYALPRFFARKVQMLAAAQV